MELAKMVADVHLGVGCERQESLQRRPWAFYVHVEIRKHHHMRKLYCLSQVVYFDVEETCGTLGK